MVAARMGTWVIDTNVLLVADLRHQDISPECVSACVLRLQAIQVEGEIVLDDGFEILEEYQHKTDANRGKTVAQVFLKWLWRNPGRWFTVHLERHPERGYAAFPSAPELAAFDPADRKFIAAAVACSAHPPILQAADSKWLSVAGALQHQGIAVEFLCPDDLRRFAARKGL